MGIFKKTAPQAQLEKQPEKQPEKSPQGPKKPNKKFLAAAFLAVAGIMGYQALNPGPKIPEVPYTDVVEQARQGKIDSITVPGGSVLDNYTVEGVYKGDGKTPGQKYTTVVPKGEVVAKDLEGMGVKVEAETSGSVGRTLLGFLPIVLLLGGMLYLTRAQGRIAGGSMKLKTRESAKKVKFEDVAGCDEAKHDLQQMVEFLKNPKKYEALGARMPKGALLVGPPGTGKTLLARAVAGEADVPFFSLAGSDFVQMFVGLGASRVRDLFDMAKKNAPCIIFIDEIDAVGGKRGHSLGGGHDEREQTLNQLLVGMDGFADNSGVIILAATNRPDVLDPALTRPGRLDRNIMVGLPDVAGREAILKVHTAKKPLADDVSLGIVARATPGFSGADLENLANEAAILATTQGRKVITLYDFEQAKDKILMGEKRPTLAITEDEKKLTAYHEGGHALLAYYEKHSDPIHKATIMPRGRTLGAVWRLPEGDRTSMSMAHLKADLAVAMGGRLAEELIFGRENITTGAKADIDAVTDSVVRMVKEWGMSDKLGFLNYEGGPEAMPGYGAPPAQKFSDETMQLADREIRALVDGIYKHASDVLTTHKTELHRLAQALIDYEELTGAEVGMVIRGEALNRPPPGPQDRLPPPPPGPNVPEMLRPLPPPGPAGP